MRKTVRLLLAVLVFSACATTNPPAGSNSQKMRSLYDSFARGDIPTVLAAFDPNIEWWEAENLLDYAQHNPYRGPQAVAEGVFKRVGQEWQGFQLHIEDIIDAGDTVVTLGRYSGMSRATNKPLNAQFVHVWKFRDGKIVRLQQFTDTAQFVKVAGMK